MSGFDINKFLPFYLDETDEQIAALNDALLRLEENPAEAQTLQEAFRMAHSIKGAARLLGFDPVVQLTHHLESYFDLLRSGKRELERASLDVCFECLDALRDYHKKLRDAGQSDVDLTACIALMERCVEGSVAVASPTTEPPAADGGPEIPAAAAIAGASEPGASPAAGEPEHPSGYSVAAAPDATGEAEVEALTHRKTVRLTAVFEPQLTWKDMKARLILSRISERAQIIGSEPPLERLEEVESLPSVTFLVQVESDPEDLRPLADVDGVLEVRIERPGEKPPSDASEPKQASFASGAAGAAPRSEPAPILEQPALTLPSSEAVEPKTGATSSSDRVSGAAAAQAAPSRPEPGAAGSATRAAARKTRIGETLRVDVDRLDNLMNLAGELVINKARFGQIMTGLKDLYGGIDLQLLTLDTEDRFERFARQIDALTKLTGGESEAREAQIHAQFRSLRENFEAMLRQLESLRRGQEHLQSMTEAMDQLTRIAEGIQKGVLDTRMVPIGPLFERLRRVVRDLGSSSGKQVELNLGGESTELDKRMIDELGDPLVHMIRNSVDHGLEPPEERLRQGKPASGTVSLRAAHRGNSIVITVSDDGRGIDTERIRRKVIAQGLVRESEAASLTERQLIAFIWHPGLSTAEKVTDISGRGVGMDIVKSHIENLNGSVDVRTELGRGTTFTIRLPLTLAILPSLVVRIYDEYYAIPLDAADEIIEVRRREIRHVHGTATFTNRGRVLALLELGEVFRWGGKRHPSHAGGLSSSGGDAPEKWTVVLVQNGETTMGLRVDEMVGIQEVVLKSLERNFRAIAGLSGASILGDGRVSLILDIDSVIGMASNGATPARGREMASSA
jgi:two-component system chemotaxis sensor kinase CheA